MRKLQKVASEVLTATIDAIQATVKKGDKVALIGFGTFEQRKRAARTGRNPQNGYLGILFYLILFEFLANSKLIFEIYCLNSSDECGFWTYFKNFDFYNFQPLKPLLVGQECPTYNLEYCRL